MICSLDTLEKLLLREFHKIDASIEDLISLSIALPPHSLDGYIVNMQTLNIFRYFIH